MARGRGGPGRPGRVRASRSAGGRSATCTATTPRTSSSPSEVWASCAARAGSRAPGLPRRAGPGGARGSDDRGRRARRDRAAAPELRPDRGPPRRPQERRRERRRRPRGARGDRHRRLARARARARPRLAARGWRLVVDARDADDARPRRRAAFHGVTALAGDVTDDRHRQRARRRRRRRGRPARQQRERARPEPAAGRSRAYPLDELARVYEVERARAARAVQLALPLLGRARAIVNVTSDAARRAVRGLGRLRVVQGRARPADARSSPPSIPQLRVYAVDPGDMRTALHQEAFPGEDISDRPPPERERAGPARADRDAARRAGATRARRARGSGMSALAVAAPEREAHEPPEARGAGRDDVALLVADRADGSLRHAALPRARPLPAARRPARRQHLGDAAGRAARRRSASGPCGCGSRRPSAGGALDGRAARADDRVAASPRRRSDAVWLYPAAAAPSCSPRSRAASGSWSPGSTWTSPLELYLGATAAPIRYGYVPAAGRSTAYQTVFAREPGSAEMPSAGRPFTAGARRPSSSRAAS